MVSPSFTLTAEYVRTQLGEAYGSFPSTQQEHHAELLRSLTQPDDVALRVDPAGEFWRVTICTADRLGILATLAGLLAAYRMNIMSADAFSLEAPRITTVRSETTLSNIRPLRSSSGPRRRTLDVFVIRLPADAPPDVWDRFKADLQELVRLLIDDHVDEVRDRIIDRVSATLHESGGTSTGLLPMYVGISNSASPRLTRLDITSDDTQGFLFAFTNALSGSLVNIDRAFIRTVEGKARDTFWITDNVGRKIVDDKRINDLRMVTVLVKQFTHLLPNSPNPGQAFRQFRALVGQMVSKSEWKEGLNDLDSAEVLESLSNLMGMSRFLWEDFLRLQHENLYPVIVNVPALNQAVPHDQLRSTLAEKLRDAATTQQAIQELNDFKDREMFRIDLRHITGRTTFNAFSAELTDLTEVVVEAVAGLAHRVLGDAGKHPPLGREAWRWSMGALGKFGGRELGYGSDIEMLIVYDIPPGANPEEVSAGGGYFNEFVRAFQDGIHARQDGIFEIDLRLRPYGSAGSLSIPLSGFTSYYTEGGDAQQFERLALVKLRPVAGDPRLGEQLLAARDAFVYSGRPLDWENIRHLRSRQATELVQRGDVNAKYSPGGLVDIEYYVQACQIEGGAANPDVRVTNTLDAIDRLETAGLMPPEKADTLREAYGFMRNLIDALRVVRGNAKDLNIPKPDSAEYAYLARRLAYASPQVLQAGIERHMTAAQVVWEG